MVTLPDLSTASLRISPPALPGVPSGDVVNAKPIGVVPIDAFALTLKVTFATVPLPFQFAKFGFTRLTHCVPGFVVNAN